ncbi:PTS sugar transporter subunit IIA [Enterococcus sp. AZ072]|uniref:PTS sugar transporter subunit IIA n=1 Tax=unclassified Enterococcus TaxID=2608891 RepID=UPI003D2CEE39
MIDEGLIVLDSVLTNKASIIYHLSEKAKELGYLNNSARYIDAVNEREEEFSTAIGYDVSIPHGKSKEVINPFICFLRTKQPIQWDNAGKPVELVFMLGIPEENKTTFHLKVLAEISKKLLDDGFRNDLLTGNKELILDSLYQVEKKIGGN